MLKIILLMLATSLFVGCETTTTRLLGNEDLEGTHWDGLELGGADSSWKADTWVMCSNESNNCSITVVDADSTIVYFSQSMNDGDGKYDLTEKVNLPEGLAGGLFSNIGTGFYIENSSDSSYYGTSMITTSYGKFVKVVIAVDDSYIKNVAKYTVIEWNLCKTRNDSDFRDNFKYPDAAYNLFCDSQDRPLKFIITNNEWGTPNE